MILVDVHAHLDTKFFKDNIEKVLKRAEENNVIAIIANGVDKNTNRQVLNLAEKYEIVKPALGIYPTDALEKETQKKRDWDITEEIDFIENNKHKITALGEIGLDYKNGENKKDQIAIFKKLIDIGKKNNLPLIVHSRQAEKDAIDILEKIEYSRIVMHCFSGSFDLVKRIIENRWYFSIPTHIVRSEHMQKLVKIAPSNRLLTETDSPFLSPFKNKKNEPGFVIESLKKIAEIKELDLKEAANLVYMNYARLFLK
ncbi:YchF/TatD family DNA exonuclease [Candidatus Woesearchaeota archaeon]|nr:YchF/TatD family DNA exonuclease [Candidatus Woesearchaeota archaeon]